MKSDEWTELDSGHMARSKYNSMDRTLTIEFKNGYVYDHHGVPPGEHQAFMDAPSQGEYYHQFIKGYYHTERVK